METSILNELLKTDKPVFELKPEPTFRYEEIKKGRVNGKRAVFLPNGRILAKSMDRKQGKSVWVTIGHRMN